MTTRTMISIFSMMACGTLVGEARAQSFQTSEAPYITLAPGAPAGSAVKAVISSGDTIGGFEFQGIPDGVGIAPGRHGRVEVYVAHEETTVPFFGTADFQNASISRLVLDRHGGVVNASVALPSSAGFLRFCSAFMAGPAEGFSRYTFFTGEETNDIVDVPPNATYGADPAIAPQRQGGYAVALDTRSGAYRPIPGMGRLNHENTVVVPGGWRHKRVLLTTDDTFSAPSSQLYMYIGHSAADVWNDRGRLYAFQVTRTNAGPVNPSDPFNGANDYLDIQPGDDWQGRFIPVPKAIAEGTTGLAPQDALEQWSNDNNVFQFIRLEDVAYDRHNPRVVYIADTGSTRVVADPTTGRLVRGPSGTVGFADNGRVFRFELSRHNPRRVTSFSVYADADAAPSDPTYVPFRAPDNIETSENSLMLQEDAANAVIWRHDFATGAWTIVATVNDPSGESSGIVDASSAFGAGWWALVVQGHGTLVRQQVVSPSLTLKLESGQLLLMKLPGS